MSDEADSAGPGGTDPTPDSDRATGPADAGGVVGGGPDGSPGTRAGTAEIEGGEPQSAVVTTGDTTVIARTVARIAVPVVFLVAVSLTLRGHNLPGGGFIGGVLTAIAVVLLYVVFGLQFVQDRLVPGDTPGAARAMFAVGLAVALASGLVPILFGDGFLTQGFLVLPEPLPGPFFHEFEVATALAFDLGVFFVVVGGLLTIVREVGAE